jgi:hypothetical protein
MERDAVKAAAALARAEAAGVQFRVEGGEVRISAAAPPPSDLLAHLREHRAEILELLDHDAGEAEAMVAFYAAPASEPAAPDLVARGLALGFWSHRQNSSSAQEV